MCGVLLLRPRSLADIALTREGSADWNAGLVEQDRWRLTHQSSSHVRRDLDTEIDERRVRAPMNFHITFSIAMHASAAARPAHPCWCERVALARVVELTS